MMKVNSATPQFNVPVRIFFAVIAVSMLVDKVLWFKHNPLQLAMGCFGSLLYLLLALNSAQYLWPRRLLVVTAFCYAALVLYHIGTRSSL
jgi:hypothetical protein